MEEDPLTASSVPALILAEASEPGAGGEVEAEPPGRPRRGARLGQGFAFDRKRLVSLSGAGLVGAAGCRGQQGELWGGAFAVQQGGKLSQPQV